MAMSIGEFREKLERDWHEYFGHVRETARQAFWQHVRPVCQKHGLAFMAGNGTWFLSKDRTHFYLADSGQCVDVAYGQGVYPEIERDPDVLRALQVISLEAPGFPANDLGSLMPDHKGD